MYVYICIDHVVLISRYKIYGWIEFKVCHFSYRDTMFFGKNCNLYGFWLEFEISAKPPYTRFTFAFCGDCWIACVSRVVYRKSLTLYCWWLWWLNNFLCRVFENNFFGSCHLIMVLNYFLPIVGSEWKCFRLVGKFSLVEMISREFFF